MDIFINLFNWILDGIAETILWLTEILPNSPVESWTNNDKPANVILGHITWFIPYPTMLLHFTALLLAIGVYYLYRVIGRWLKVVRG